MSLANDNQIAITQDFQDMEAELGYPSFNWNGSDYGCIPDSHKKQQQLKQGGFDVDIPTTMAVRKFAYVDCQLIQLFTTEPALNNPIILDGDSFFIKSITEDSSHTFYQIELKRKKN